MAYPTAATLDINAPAEKVWALVSDLPRMGEWSPENAGGKWVKGATGPALGAVFKGTNKNGIRRWSTTVTVIACEPSKVFEFAVTSGPLEVANWRYEFEETEAGCRVTESWSDQPQVPGSSQWRGSWATTARSTRSRRWRRRWPTWPPPSSRRADRSRRARSRPCQAAHDMCRRRVVAGPAPLA